MLRLVARRQLLQQQRRALATTVIRPVGEWGAETGLPGPDPAGTRALENFVSGMPASFCTDIAYRLAAFQQADVDNSKTVDLAELQTLLLELHPAAQPEDAAGLLAAADENGDASPRAAPAETPAFSAADFPSLGVATGIKEQAQQWVTPPAAPAQTIEPPAAVQAAPAEPPKPPPPAHKPKDGRKCGVCAWFEPSKKMGFIRQDEGGDIFVHASDLRDGVSIEEGDRVEYAVAQFKDRNKAIDVVPISQIVSTTPEEDASDGTQEEEVPVFDPTDFPSLGGAARPAAPAAWGASAVPSSLVTPPVVAPAPLVAKRPAPPPSPPRPASTSNDGEKKDQGISQKRKTGVCLWYILKKRHGFIKPDEGGASDIFVHASDLRDGAIEEGDRVEYAVAKFKDRVKAVDVTVVAPAPAAAA